jgi:hypothetical protein
MVASAFHGAAPLTEVMVTGICATEKGKLQHCDKLIEKWASWSLGGGLHDMTLKITEAIHVNAWTTSTAAAER